MAEVDARIRVYFLNASFKNTNKVMLCLLQGDRLVDKEQKAKDDAMAKRVDIISRLAFPSVFIIFCIVFSIVCIFSPDEAFIG